MKNLMRCLCALGLGGSILLSAPLQASTPKKKTVAAQTSKPDSKAAHSGKTASKKPNKTPSKAPSKAPQTSKNRSPKTASSVISKSTAEKPSKAPSCNVAKGRRGKRQSACKAEPVEPALQSPIQDNALNKSATSDKTPEIKARSAPDRAYAVDGETFFFQGRKYHVAGMEGSGSSDMAKQRLQKALESGSLYIDPIASADDGVSTANVRINGRDLIELLR